MSRPRPFGAATHSATGAAAALARTGPFGRLSLRLSRGAAAPAATSAHAVPRMALDSRKRGEYRKRGDSAAVIGQFRACDKVAPQLYKMQRAVSFVRSMFSVARR